MRALPCAYCRSTKHSTPNCPQTWGGQERRAAMRCPYCWSDKHTLKACPYTWEGSANRTWHKGTIADDYIED